MAAAIALFQVYLVPVREPQNSKKSCQVVKLQVSLVGHIAILHREMYFFLFSTTEIPWVYLSYDQSSGEVIQSFAAQAANSMKESKQ